MGANSIGDILPGLVERLLVAAKELTDDDTKAKDSYFGLENIDRKNYCQGKANFNLWMCAQ